MSKNLEIEEVENEIARMHQRKFCLITSRASSALYISAWSIVVLNLNVPTDTPVGLVDCVPEGNLNTELSFKKLNVVIIALVVFAI